MNPAVRSANPVRLKRKYRKAARGFLDPSPMQIKKYGMTFLYAGTEKDNDSKITTIIRFDTMNGLKAFKADEELNKERAAAGVILEKSVTTIMGEDLLVQYKG